MKGDFIRFDYLTHKIRMMKTAIVTGASGNMGQAVVKKFLKEGYHVIGTALEHDTTIMDVDDPKFIKVVVDLMDETAADSFIKKTAVLYEKIDVLLCTVGGFAMGSMADTTAGDIQKQYRLNFETAYHVVRPVFEIMKKQQYGRIFLVGSKPGLDAQQGKGMLAYSLAKSLVFRLAELMNEEAKGTNVVTAVLVPGTIDTEQNRLSMPDADPSKWVKPEAIADAVYFYCTEQAASIRQPVIKLYNNA